jgi:hypothetical protein
MVVSSSVVKSKSYKTYPILKYFEKATSNELKRGLPQLLTDIECECILRDRSDAAGADLQ